MAAVVEQSTKASNGLSQTFNITFSPAPTEGNLLVAFLFHDEASADIATITSSGWTRMATVVYTLSSFDYRLHVYAKFAGASESTTVAVDLGEPNRRTHGWAVEFSGSEVTELNAEDAATQVSTDNGTVASTSNQVDDPIDIGAGQLGLAIAGTTSSSTVPPSWASEITNIDNWNSNFKATGIGYADPPAVGIQPSASWNTTRQNVQLCIALGVPPPMSTVLAGSTFRATKVPAA